MLQDDHWSLLHHAGPSGDVEGLKLLGCSFSRAPTRIPAILRVRVNLGLVAGLLDFVVVVISFFCILVRCSSVASASVSTHSTFERQLISDSAKKDIRYRIIRVERLSDILSPDRLLVYLLSSVRSSPANSVLLEQGLDIVLSSPTRPFS